MKKIGFIDYFLSEWHANNYPAWIDECCEKTGEDFKVAYAYAEVDVSPYDGITTDQWCEKFDAERCLSIEELCEKSDCIFILSPDNPEKHLEYAKIAFAYNKPIYIDKTFAPNLAEAKEIYKIAEKYNTPFFTSSALRFANELDEYSKPVYSAIITGGGSEADIYIIHQLEMLVRLMGIGAKRVMSVSGGNNATIHIAYENGRNATINFGNAYPFTLSIQPESGAKSKYATVASPYFKNMLLAILEFFNTQKAPVSKEQTLEVMALRDACLKSQKSLLEFVKAER